MLRIMLVDDDLNVSNMIAEYAQAESWHFDKAANGPDALRLFAKYIYDLIVLDVMMPGMDGWKVLRTMRENSDVPVIMLTARDEEYDRLLGFELGADDYLSKPFSPRELIARMRALLKRSGALGNEHKQLVFGSLQIDLSAHKALLEGNILALTPREYDLLAFMASNHGQVFTRDHLLDQVWGFDYIGDSRTVDTHVKSLREKLGDNRSLIATVWGTGYRFEVEQQ